MTATTNWALGINAFSVLINGATFAVSGSPLNAFCIGVNLMGFAVVLALAWDEQDA